MPGWPLPVVDRLCYEPHMARRARALVSTLILLFLPLVALASVPAGTVDGSLHAARSRAATTLSMRWIALPSESETSLGESGLERSWLAVVPSVLVAVDPLVGRATSMARHAHHHGHRVVLQRLPLRTSSAGDSDPH
jgi:hypothetical protein